MPFLKNVTVWIPIYYFDSGLTDNIFSYSCSDEVRQHHFEVLLYFN